MIIIFVLARLLFSATRESNAIAIGLVKIYIISRHPYATGVLSLLFPFLPFIWHIPKI